MQVDLFGVIVEAVRVEVKKSNAGQDIGSESDILQIEKIAFENKASLMDGGGETQIPELQGRTVVGIGCRQKEISITGTQREIRVQRPLDIGPKGQMDIM